jgi:hypothetical protein
MNKMNRLFFLFGCIHALFIAGCKSQSPKPFVSAFSNPHPTTIEGKWSYSNTIWSSSVLIFKSDGTFELHDQTCLGQIHTNGKWSGSGERTVLSGIGSQESAKPDYESSNGIISGVTRSLLTGATLLLKKDTLYVVGENPLLSNHRFHKIGDNPPGLLPKY